MTRRLIAGLLTLCMLVSLCPPNAFALRSSAAVVPETESTVVEPAAEEPEVEEPAAEEPKAEEPAAEEPAAEEPQTEDTPAEDTPAEDPAAEDPQTEEPAVEEPKAEEETPKYATVNVNGSVKLTASAEDGGKWASDNIAAATVGAEKADAGEKNVAEVFGVAEGYTTVTYTKGDAVETWIVTVKAAPAEDTPAEDTPAEEEPADVTYSVSRYLEEEAPEGSEVPFTYTLIDTISVTGKPGAEVTLPAVSGAIAVDTDADYIFPYEDGTAALTLPAQTPEDLSLSVFYVKTEALPEINDFNLEVPDSTPYRTYYFYNVETGGEPVEAWTQIVTNGDTLRLPAAPAKENAKFTGWYANGTRIGDSYEQVTIDNVTEDKDIIVRPRFEDVGYVFFLDKKGAVCHTAEGKPGEEMADNEFALAKAAASGSLEPDDSILSWKNGDAEVTSVTFEAGSITLSPDVKKGFWVTFDVDGGEYMAPVFREAGTTLTPETPVKPGYVFEGWYMDGVADPVTSVSDTANLTAHWSASSETNYTVIHWLENADDTNYTYFRSEVKQGTTGALTEAAAIPSGDSEFEDRDYYEVQDITQQTIAGDGSTIVNVYYNRRTYTVTYKDVPVKCDIPEHKHSVDGGCYELTCTNTDWWHSHSVWWGCYELTCTQQEHTHGNACQIGSKTVTAKWGANIAHTWPGGNFIVQSTGKHQASIDVMPKYNETFTLDTAVPDENAKDVSSAGYWLQKIESNNKDDFANGYTKDHVDRISGTDWSISAEDSYPITGFTFYKYVTKSGEGKAYNGAKFYYTRNTYNITLLYKDGTNVQNPISYKYEQTVNPLPTDLTAPAGTPKGYKFAGWFADPEGTQKFELPKTMPARGLTAYAVWKAEPVNATVHFSVTMNGETRTLTVPYGSTLAEAPGYNEMLVDLAKANGNKKPVAWCTEDGTLFDVNTKLYSPVTLKPMFAGDADAYTVTYKEDGKDPIQDTQTYKSGSYAKAKEPEVLLDSNGNYFSGWTDDNDNTYQPGEAIEIAGNVTLTAVYKAPPARTYIVYHSNFGTDAKYSVGPYMVNAKVPSLAAYPTDKLPDHEKDGYKFVGWSLTPDGSEAIDQVVIKGNENNDLYAVWELNEFPYTIKYYHDSIDEANYINKYDGAATQVGTEVTIRVDLLNAELPDGYVAKTAEEKITITANAANNVLNVVYTKRTDLSYTVNYLEKGTTNVLATAKTQGNQTFGTEITSADEVISINGYNFDSADKEKLTIGTGENVINLYYTKRTDLSYTVNYLEKGTTNVLATAKTQGNQTFGTEITSADEVISINGYNFDSADKEKLTIGTGENVINLYYTKRTDLSYTVNYLEKGTTNVLATAKTQGDQTFGTEITSADEVISINGYNFDSADKEKLTIGTGENVINLYYTKRTDLSYTVNYLEKGTTNVLATAKTQGDQTFGTEITSADEVISINGYNFDSADKEKLTIGTGENVINLYYTKRTDLSYTVNYLEKGTTNVLATAKTQGDQTFGTEITSADEVISINGYNFDSADKEKLTIGTGENVINLYYTKRTDLSYTVNYLEKGTTNVLATAKTQGNQTFGTEITSADEVISINGYNFDSADKEKLTIGTGENVINLYYTKRTDLSYTVNYLEKGTTNVLATAKTQGDQTFGTEITSADEVISINGYNFDSADKEKLTIGTGENVINLYYTKRTDLSYTVNYLEKGTTNVLATAKTQGDQTFGTEITSADEVISINGYNFDSADKEKLTIGTGENVINLYYTKRTDLSYTVNYLEKGTTNVLATAKTQGDQTFGTEITSADEVISINGYNFDSADKEKLTIGTGENVINLYYTKRTDLSYTVNYLEKGTTNVLATAKTQGDQTFGTEITSADEVISINGYNFDSADKEKLTIGTGENVINLYYTKRTDLSYTVNYLEKGTTNVLATAKTQGNQTFGTEITSADEVISINGYNFDSADKEKLTIGTGENVINLYYTKRTDLSYTVNYLEKGTTNVLATAKTQGDQTFGTEITSADEVISINGYNFDSADKEKLTIGTGENVINLYYTKRTDLSYTVNYYWMGTTTKVADSKTVDKQTFDAEVTESAIDVAGYTKADSTEKTITIAVEGNEINFYYYKNVTVTADNKSKTYGSDDPELTASVEGTIGSDTVDYNVTRADGEAVGTYTITPSGEEIQGNYKVSYEEGVFTITAQSINPVGPDPENPDPNYTGATVDSPADHVYDGAAHKFVPVVKNGDDVVMTEGTDYEVNYSTTDFTNVTGTITVTITGKGNYSGTVTRTYQITPAPYTVTTESASKVFDGVALTAGGKVEGIVTGETYTLTMTGSQTIQGSCDNTYELTWGTAKQSNYELKSETIGTLTVTKQSITPGTDPENPNPDYLGVTVGDLGNLVYNGLSQEQEPVVKDKNKVDLVKGTDYTLSYSTDTTNVGTVTVTVTGIGNYTGTVTRTYEITPAPYTVTTYSAIKVYDGHPLTAGGQVNGLVNGETCTVNTTASRTEYGSTENKPYTLTWGTANKNNYEFKGETIGTLTVVRQSINPTDPPIPTDPDGEKPIDPDQSYYGGVEVKAPENVKYNGQSQEQKPVVTDKDGTALVENTDYTLSYSEDTVNAGTVTVTVTGKGNYQGKVEVTYQITKRTVTLTSEGGSKVYDGTPLTKPGVVVGGDGFVEGEVTAINATGTVTNVTEGKVKNAITYTEGTGFKAGNYEITKVEGELYVTKAKEGIVTVTGKSATYVWTGDEREVTGFTHDGAARLITVELKKGAEAAARGTAVGTYAMGLKAENFTASSPNYETVKVVVVDGELVIETINITVTVTVRGNKETVTFDGDPHTVTGYKVISAIANTGMDMGMDGFTLTLKGTASATGTEVGTYNMGLTAGDFTITSDIYRVVRVVVEDGGLEITPAPEEITEPTEEIPDETVPLAPPEEDNIPDEPVPQAGPAWALVNLILSILTVLASLLLLVGYFGKKEEEAEDENGNAILDAEGNNVMNDIKKRGGWRLASLVPAILSVIAFLLTENMRNPMILVDRWTLLMVIIAVVQVLVMLLSKKKTEDNTQEA